jgi:Bacterial Ig-like domain
VNTQSNKYFASRSLYLLLAIVICVGLASTALFAWFYPAACSGDNRSASFAYSLEPAEAGLKLSVSPVSSEMLSGEEQQTAIVLANNSTRIIDSFSLDNEESRCFHFSLGSDTLKLPLVPNQSAKLLASVQSSASCRNGRYPLSLSYSWSERAVPSDGRRLSTHPQRTTQAVATDWSEHRYAGFAISDPISINTAFLRWTLCFAHLSSALFRNVMLPVVLAILGFAFQRGQSERDAVISAKNAERDAASSTRNAAISRRSQVVNIMIPDYLNVVQTYYLPISRSLGRVGVEARAYFEKPNYFAESNSPRRLLASILLVRKHLEWLANKRGGIYFISGTGEKLFGLLYNKLNQRLHKKLGRGSLIDFVESLPENKGESADLDECFQKQAFAHKLLPEFIKWIADDNQEVQDCVALTNMMRTVLNFECSRPFYQTAHSENEPGGSWYLDPPQINLPPAKAIFTARDENFQDNYEKTRKEYLAGIPSECRATPDPISPTVGSTIPVNGEITVAINQVLSAIFSEPMNRATLISPAVTFTVTDPSGTAIAGTVNCTSTIATFTPAVSLANNTLFRATITTAAENVSGKALASSYVWTFTTAAPSPEYVVTAET